MNRYALNDRVVYEGRTYRFPGTVCGITDDGQVIVRATGAPNGDYAGMKHIYAPNQLRRDDGAGLPGRGPAALALVTAGTLPKDTGAKGQASPPASLKIASPEPASLKIGRFYWQADGAPAGPVLANTGLAAGTYPFAILGGYADYRLYTADGRCPLDDKGYTLVAEMHQPAAAHPGDGMAAEKTDG